MKLILFIGSLNTGGTETQFTNLAIELAKAHDIVVLTFFPGGKNWDRCIQHGIYPVALLKQISKSKFTRIFQLCTLPCRFKFLLKKILKSNENVFILSFLDFSNLIAFLASNKLPVKLFWSIRSGHMIGFKYWKMMLADKICAMYSSRVNGILYNSQQGKIYYEAKLGFSSQNSKRLYNAVDCNIFKFDPIVRAQIRHQLKIKPDIQIIGMVGRLTPVKNYELALHAFARLPSDFVLLIVGGGGGDYKKKLDFMAQELNIAKRVYFVGDIKNTAEFYPAMDIFLHTSLSEGTCNAILEAMACQLPCVVSKVGDAPEHLPTGNQIFENNDLATAVNALEKIIKLNNYQEIGIQNRNVIIKQFSIKNTIQTILELIG